MSSTPPPQKQGTGLLFAVGAYGLWGILPVFFLALMPASPVEIVAARILLSLVFCFVLIAITRSGLAFAATLRDRRSMLLLALAGVLILTNWLTYVFAATTGHVVEAALGYFLNPIVTVLLGVFLLRERLRPLQWTAIGLSAVAALVLAIGYGSVPWIALILAFSFGIYGLVKKQVGPRVDAITGLTIETMWLSPLALAALIVIGVTTGLTTGTVSAWHTALMLSAGVVTAVPLLFFAAAARRLKLTVLGLSQYLAPLLQFLFGVIALHEDMPFERWVGFGLVWVALLILTIDMFTAGRGPRRSALEPA
ncbi:chloramphenicol-sensitive protein RarD [Diaminobutyricimonas aerilata]|uniref:Chloramphenicol-sensitive protein RarD n=1 Tax=Diaminobutyricimonas aerilata TaxID=1162967 RepID=A0A2M9CMQ9_9MICO|nr:EamA family transporter RarD [Diaminobutyricimonas aerilata]PJJ73172.1 chloramphenicol-sensitive protein RarD [Diaminobutyricimonas aerilata]